MAVSKDDLLIKIDASTVDAVKSIKTLEDVFGGLGMQVVKANAAVDLALKSFEIFKAVVEKISEPFKEALHASIEYEASLNKLRNSLKLTGQFSDDILKRFEDFGATMEMNTTLTQEQAYEMLSLAKVVGVTDEQAMQMVQTAKDLATVTGKDVNDSFRALQGSLRGNSRELIAIDPTLKKFGASAFMSGEAIDYLSEKLDGFAAASAKGFKGVTAQAKNFRDEIARNIGDVLAVAFDIKGTEEFKRAMYLNILKTVEEIKPRLIEFAEGVRDIKRELVSGIVEAARSFGEAMATVGRVIAVIDFKTVAASIVVLTVALTAMVISMKADAVLIFIANLQALAATLIAFSKVAIAASIPVGIFALKLIGISAVIGTVMVAVDFFNKNGIKPLVAGFTSLVGKIEEIIGKFMQFVGLFQAGGKIIADGWRLQNKGAQEFSKIEMGDGLKSTIDKINEMRDAWKGSGVAAKETEDAAKKIKGAFAGRNIVDPAAQEAYLQALNTIEQKTAQIRLEAERSGLTQVEIIERQLEAMLKAIDAEKERIKISKQFSDVQKKNLMGALDDQKNAAQGEAAAKTANAPGQEYEQAIIAGKSMTNDITKAFQSGTMGMVTGMLGAVDAFVGAAQAVVDFIPGLLDKIANLFNSITELPLKIVASLDKVFSSILNYITNAIPNLLKAIPQIMKVVIKFLVEGIPQAFDALFKAIPDLVIQLVDAIPDFVAGFIQQLIQTIPLIVISFIENMIPQIPRIVIAIVRVMYIEIPKAIIRGIIQGISAVINAAKNMFKGVKVVDSKDIGKAVKDIKKLSGSTADMFGVKDLGGSGDTVKQGANQIGDAIKNGMDAGMKMLIDAWRWINDKIIAPIGNFFKGMFDGVVDGAKRLFGFFKDLFDRYTLFLGNIFNGIKNVGSTIIDTFKNIGNIIIDGIKGGLPALGKMFQKLFDELNPANLFKKMFDVSGADGQGTVEKTLGIDIPFLKFAQGGHVPGNARVSGDSLINDRILALLSPGEAVIPRSLMEDKRIRAIIDQILKGDFVPPAFKLGGYAGQISDKVSSATSGSGGTLGKVLSGDFKGAASDIEHMDAKQAGEELAKAGENALKIIESMLPGAPWKMVWEKVQDMVMKMFGANKFASGGFVTGASGTDMIPARLTAGEFVLNKDAVANIGLGNLNRMNNGGRSSMTPTSITQHIDIKIESKGERIDESFIRQRLMPALKEELRRASLDGERLLSSGGVR